MSIIPQFPQELLNIHHSWHDAGAHGSAVPGRAIPAGFPGSGIEFLTFHRDFVMKFHAWYDGQPFADQAAVAPWLSIPPELKALTSPPLAPRYAWTATLASQEFRVMHNVPQFGTQDEFGIFLETTIHDWIHGATARAFSEPEVEALHSPESTYFYKIHGLVTHWWERFQTRVPKTFTKDLHDPPRRVDDLIKTFTKDLADLPPRLIEPTTTKSRTKDLADVPPRVEKNFGEGGPSPTRPDEEIVSLLVHRLSTLESIVARHAFIRPDERPDVDAGAEVKERERGENKPRRAGQRQG